jgi:hypothetical protein
MYAIHISAQLICPFSPCPSWETYDPVLLGYVHDAWVRGELTFGVVMKPR